MLAQTIRQQLKGLFLLYAFAGTVLFLLKIIANIPGSVSDMMPLYLQILNLVWPIFSASLLFNKEFQSGSLPYLFAAPESRKQILTKKVLPSLISGIFLFLLTTSVILFFFSKAGQIPAPAYFMMYLIIQAMATLFSFLPSILTIFPLSVISSGLLLGFIPFSYYLIISWHAGSLLTARDVFRWYSFPASDFIWMIIPITSLILLGAWFWGFTKYAEPDHRRSYRKMAPKGGLIFAGAAIFTFIMVYVFVPVYPWGEYSLTREGHLFFHGNHFSKLINEQESHILRHHQGSTFLAETDSELILTLPGENDQSDLIGWNKSDGNRRLICSMPQKPLQNMIFQPPHSILSLAASNPREWTEIDLISGQKTDHSFTPLAEEDNREACYPIAALSDGKTRMILISNLRYFEIDYGSSLPLTLCQADQPPQLLGESIGLPIQFSENEIVLFMGEKQSMEKYRLHDGQFSLVESVALPEISYWPIVRDYRFWPIKQPLYGIFGKSKEPILLTVNLETFEASSTALGQSENGRRMVSTTPRWGALITQDAKANEYIIQRLDQPQASFKIAQNQEGPMYFDAQAYGFLSAPDNRPIQWCIQMPEGKIEPVPQW